MSVCEYFTNLLFIFSAIHYEFQDIPSNTRLDALLGRQYFFPLMLSIAYLILACSLSFLFFDQVYNICMNITTNERMNWQRYHYLQDDKAGFVNRCPLYTFVIPLHQAF